MQVDTSSFHITTDDYRWLTSDEAESFLAQAAAAAPDHLVGLAHRLRRQLSAARVHLVLEQVELRRRARAKFSLADQMFFTPCGLQQATGEAVARYKASRFPAGVPVADLCCGIGGDFMALLQRGPTIGVDNDQVMVVLARANSRLIGNQPAEVKLADARLVDVRAVEAWHIDPDRRPAGTRTTRPQLSQPDLASIAALLKKSEQAAIKLAPAAELPPEWADRAERQWIGAGRECKQQVAWFGRLAHHPGRRVATVVGREPAAASHIVGGSRQQPALADRADRYVFEPHAAVRAARLGDVLACRHQLCRLGQHSSLLTGPRLVDDPALAAFEVLEVLPLDRRRLKRRLVQLDAGPLEIKARSVPLSVQKVCHRLPSGGRQPLVLLVNRHGRSFTAILARRVATDPVC